MRFVIQRVKHAEVKAEDRVIGEIGQGLLVLLGISSEDNEQNDKEISRAENF